MDIEALVMVTGLRALQPTSLEFIAYAVADWCRFKRAGTIVIDPGCLWQNTWWGASTAGYGTSY